MILVTGGTGLVGSHLLFQLLKKNDALRAIYRSDDTLKKVQKVFSYYSEDYVTLFNKIEWVKADLNNIPQLEAAFKNITHVYHCAAFVSFQPKAYKLLRKINIEGTANIINLCIAFNITKLCYVSSIATIGHHTNSEKLIDEKTEWNAENDNSIYAITKYGAELEVWRGTQEGLDTVIVNPGIILGAGFWSGNSSGNLFKRVKDGLSYYTNGVTGFVDVWDVVNVMEQLMQSKIKNERFILVSHNLSYKDFFIKTAKVLQIKPPKKEAKPWLVNSIWRVDWLKSKVLGQPRALTKQASNALLSVRKYDASKLENTLEFNFKPIEKTIETVSNLYLKDLNS
ncbi:NAD-dependent epimerase/dehydratase family protein [Winogradskyella endarachnes]|uniref:NAD-dependent epimerase/dehydratase family protein n=1 Tax=Winogradskyella endarachnes TaxID=2681965 RepID=A0A6L6U8H3_9FLAO|nr:NAD-dependent epimerase/dehydratase family protein [Winogradskyella endarachnes]MUU78605.1 NAD-dependent epimerase/dehydratase family protein [Winogradskyella endarachnes]